MLSHYDGVELGAGEEGEQDRAQARQIADPIIGREPEKITAKLPTMISIRATEMPTRIEISAETRARPIQSAEISQTFSMCGPQPSPALVPAIRKMPRRKAGAMRARNSSWRER